MPVIDEKPLTKICLRIFQEDYDYIRQMAQARQGVSANEIMRTIMHNYVKQLRSVERDNIDRLPVYSGPQAVDIEL